MKPGHRRESKEFSPQNKYNDSHHSKPWLGSKKDSNNYNNYRRINKYRHPAREPRHNIRFEYATGRGKWKIMRVLNRMIEYLKGKSDREIESIKNMPKYDQRGVHEVSEDSIATITIDEIQRTLKEDLNIVYDALVASNYIEEITEASLPKGYTPEDYFTSIPDTTDICQIDDSLGSEKGTVFKIDIENRTINTLFDTGATRSVMSADTFKILKLKDKDLTTKNIP